MNLATELKSVTESVRQQVSAEVMTAMETATATLAGIRSCQQDPETR